MVSSQIISQKASAQMALKTTTNHSETQYYINLQQAKLRQEKKRSFDMGDKKREKYHNKLRAATLKQYNMCLWHSHTKKKITPICK